MDENVKKFVAGFDLAGRREKDGMLHSFHNKSGVMKDFPKEVELFGMIYTREGTKKGENGYETAFYV